jgi:hypothetical protein
MGKKLKKLKKLKKKPAEEKDITSSKILCYYNRITNKEETLRVTNRDILRNIKIVAKNKSKNLEKISVGIGKKKNYLSSTISKKKKLVSLEILLDVSNFLGCELMELLHTKNELDRNVITKRKEDDKKDTKE